MTDEGNKTPQQLRAEAKGLIDLAWEIDAAATEDSRQFIVVETIQDGRPMASGPMTFDQARLACQRNPNLTICDYGALLP